jgi:hypothetical protein
MHRSHAAAAAITLGAALALSVSANAQFNRDSHKPAIGYQDENGTFHPMERVEPDASALTTVKGVVKINFVISVRTTLPSGTKIYCGADLHAESVSETNPTAVETYDEEAAAQGTTTSCSLTINYAWNIYPTAVTVENLLSGSYTVVAYNPELPTVATTSVGSRESTSTIAGLTKIPATGTTTTLTIDVTL